MCDLHIRIQYHYDTPKIGPPDKPLHLNKGTKMFSLYKTSEYWKDLWHLHGSFMSWCAPETQFDFFISCCPWWPPTSVFIREELPTINNIALALTSPLCYFILKASSCAYLGLQSDCHRGLHSPTRITGIYFQSIIVAVTSLRSIVCPRLSCRGSNLSSRYFALTLFCSLNIFGTAILSPVFMKGEPSCLLGFPLVFSNEQFQ